MTDTPATTVDNHYTRGLAGFVANLQYEELPVEVRHRARLMILDADASKIARLLVPA